MLPRGIFHPSPMKNLETRANQSAIKGCGSEQESVFRSPSKRGGKQRFISKKYQADTITAICDLVEVCLEMDAVQCRCTDNLVGMRFKRMASIVDP